MNYNEALESNFHHFLALQDIVRLHGFPAGGGSYMMDGRSLDYHAATKPKQDMLYRMAQNANGRVVETGVYAGHSCFIMLMANPDLVIDAIDPGYPFTKPCTEYLNEHFGGRLNFIQGLSHEELPKLKASGYLYSLIHIDGQHDPVYIADEMRQIETMRDASAVLVVDDIEGAIHGMTEILPRLSLIERPACLWPNAAYSFL